MPNVDYSLIYQAQKFITAENVHSVNTWIFCYEKSQPPSQMRYEQLLREFVCDKQSIAWFPNAGRK